MDHVVITIARQYGSGGRTVGKMLAERLGISFYDKQIIHMASDESGIDVNLFGKIEAGDKIKSSLFGNKSSIYKGDLVLPGNKDFISDENLFNYQAKVVNEMCIRDRITVIATGLSDTAAKTTPFGTRSNTTPFGVRKPAAGTSAPSSSTMSMPSFSLPTMNNGSYTGKVPTSTVQKKDIQIPDLDVYKRQK